MIRENARPLAGRRVLVTGGTGFIGGRLVERLCLGSGARVRVLLRSYARAARIARFPVDMVRGDLMVARDVGRAVDGCDVVLHCAADVGSGSTRAQRRSVNVDGTRHVLEAAADAGVDRVVHLSSLAVYGRTPDGDLDEKSPRRYTGTSYADTKLESEELALRFHRERGLPVTVLQPTAVYGPFGGVWTADVLDQLRTGRVILVNGGDGLCNAVYVDDLVSAILRAAVRREAIGETYLISGSEPVTWRAFYAAFERMLGVSGTVPMSAARARARWERARPRRPGSAFTEVLDFLRQNREVRHRLLRSREVRLLRRLARKVLPERAKRRLIERLSGNGGDPPARRPSSPIHVLTPHQIEFFASKTRVRIDKARRDLGYQPVHDLDSGIELTRAWAEWAELLSRRRRSRPALLGA